MPCKLFSLVLVVYDFLAVLSHNFAIWQVRTLHVRKVQGLVLTLLQLNAEVVEQHLQVLVNDEIFKIGLANHSNQTGYLQLGQLFHSRLVEAAQEVVRRDRLNCLLGLLAVDRLQDQVWLPENVRN